MKWSSLRGGLVVAALFSVIAACSDDAPRGKIVADAGPGPITPGTMPDMGPPPPPPPVP